MLIKISFISGYTSFHDVIRGAVKCRLFYSLRWTWYYYVCVWTEINTLYATLYLRVSKLCRWQ